MSNVILETAALGFPWPTVDPFLFCAYHNDAYPRGNGNMGPDGALLKGRNLGMDFEVKDGFRMYHGQSVPGFPSHPHRGFETVTLVRRGFCDHADSLGAAARFGEGDAQWLTTGGGIVHSEMFPLLSDDEPNPLELFQIWLNLPSDEKMVPAHFSILWSHDIPLVTFGEEGRQARVKLVAGQLQGKEAPAPPPHSWAARASSDVAIWTIDMQARSACELPPAKPGSHRALYFFEGQGAELCAVGQPEQTEALLSQHIHVLRADEEVRVQASEHACQFLMLQGKPIAQPVAQHGPFVMNTRGEIQAAIRDYQATGFGGWPWPSEAPVHEKNVGRFALYTDGTKQEFER